MRQKKAEMGMGTLIVFIALILVAAVAAGVLISTTGALQNKALATGKATTAQVGTSIEAIELFGEDGRNNNTVDMFYQTVKLSSGSDDIRFGDVLLTVNLNNASRDYSYNGSVNCSDVTSINDSGPTFGIEYQIAASMGHQDGYLVKGDVAQICLLAPRAVGESETFRTVLIPRVGTPLVVDTRLPDLIVDKRVAIYP